MVPLLLMGILVVLLFGASGFWAVALGSLGILALMGIIMNLEEEWPKTWWPRARCTSCGKRGHGAWGCPAKALERMGHHDRAAHIHAALKGKE